MQYSRMGPIRNIEPISNLIHYPETSFTAERRVRAKHQHAYLSFIMCIEAFLMGLIGGGVVDGVGTGDGGTRSLCLSNA